MKRPQIDIIKYALIATAIFTLILILVYVYRFHHGLSYNHNDFADFGRQYQTERFLVFVLFMQDAEIVIELVVFFHQVVAIVGNAAWIIVGTCLFYYVREVGQHLNQADFFLAQIRLG